MMKVFARVIMAIVVLALAIPAAAQWKTDPPLTGEPVRPAYRASEDYPVNYSGGLPPAPVLAALDADDSTYNRTVGVCGPLSGAGSAVYYDTVTITNSGLGVADIVLFTSTQGDPGTCPADTYVGVYTIFNPADATANCVTSDDDDGVGNCSLVSFAVPSGETYTVVVTSFTNGATFPYQVNFDGTVPVEIQHLAVE